jgi:ABC-type branched-subunit amino acid transport system ATPase component
LTTGESASSAHVTGAYHASDGRIVLAGADITAQHAHTAARRGIVRTVQHKELFPQLTVGRVSTGSKRKISRALCAPGTNARRR